MGVHNLTIFPGGVTHALAERESYRRAEVPSARRTAPQSAQQTWGQLEASFASQAGHYSGLVSTHQAYRDSTWLQPSIHMFASACAARPFRMWREVGSDKEQLAKHWLIDLMERPNLHAKLAAYALKYRTFALFDLDGEVFWHLGWKGKGVRSPGKPPEFLTIFRKHEAFPVPYGGIGEFLGWEFQINGVRHFADRDDVVHFTNFDPLSRATDFNPFTMQALQPNRGRSPLDSKRLAVATDLAMSRYNREWFNRSIASDWHFTYEGDMTTEEQDDFRQKLSARVAGKNGEVILTANGWTANHIAGASQHDAQFSEGRKQSKEEQLAGLAPPVAMGETGATFTNTEQQMQMFYEVIVDPALLHAASTLDVNLLEDEPQVWTEFSTDDIDALQKMKAKRLETVVALTKSGWPIDIACRTVGVDVESFLGSDIAFRLYSEIPVADIIAGASKAEVATVSPADAPKPPDETNAPPSDTPPPADSVPRFIRVIDPSVMVRVVESRMAGPFDYQSTQVNLKGRIGVAAAESERMAGRAAIANAERLTRRMGYKKRDAAADDFLQAILKLIRDDDPELQKIARRFHIVAVNEGAKQIGDVLKVDTLIGIDNPTVKAFLETRGNLITSVNQTTGNQVIDAVKTGMEAGDTPETIARSIKGIFNGRKDADAGLIARNETGSALNGGRNLQMQDEGVEASEWLSVRDDKVRESHAPNTGVDGEIVAMGEPFSNGCTYPQDPAGDPSETISCRCIALPSKLGGERMFKNEEQRAIYWRAARVTSMKNVEAPFASALGRYFNAQRGRVLAEVANGLAA